MSQRSLIEINHDEPLPKTYEELWEWARSIRTYISSLGDLPDGMTLLWRRNSGDPCPFEQPLAIERAYGRLKQADVEARKARKTR